MSEHEYGIVMIHGICGSTSIFNTLLPAVDENVPVELLVLDGHGGDASGFSRSSMDKWKEQVKRAVDSMKKKCRRVIVAGHSMGCLLAIGEAVRSGVDGMFLLCPPLKLHLTWSAILNPLKVTLGLSESDPVIMAAKEAYGLKIDYNPLHFYGWPARYIELLTEIRRVNRLLGTVTLNCPVSVYLCGRDEMVSTASAAKFKVQPAIKVEVLPESTHYYFPTRERNALERAFGDFLCSVINK